MDDREATVFYKSWAWKKCREVVLIRDDYLCQVCAKHGQLTAAKIVHHIVHLKDDPLLALEEDNLMSVCHPCHETIHSKDKKEPHKEYKFRVHVEKGNPNVV